MSLPAEAEELLGRLTKADKAQLLRRFVQEAFDDFPGIESRPDVCGGDACVVRTRIPVWLLVQARQEGQSEAELLIQYPSLRAEDLANAWAYARSHAEDIRRQAAEHGSA